MRFSTRTAWDLAESDLTRAVREARGRGQELIDLTISNPTVCGFTYESDRILAALTARASLHYEPEPRGLLSAREAVTKYYAGHGAELNPGDLLLTTSTSEAYSFLFKLLCNAGDSVLVAQPSYPLFDYLAELDDLRLVSYPTFYDYGWWIDFAELERRIEPRTRALVLVHPNNPTGHATGERELRQLQALCARHGLALIVDEVFLDYGLANPVRTVLTCPSDTLTFTVSGLSKVAALPQMKVGWIACSGPEAMRRASMERLEVIADTFLSMSAPAQHALPVWMETRAAIQQQILHRIRGNVAVARRYGMPTTLRLDAGWTLMLRLPRLAVSPAVSLVSQAGVVVHPGSFYGADAEHLVVVSTLGSAENFVEGMNRLKAWCESNW